MSADTNIALVQKLYAAFGKGDVVTLLENMADDIDWGINAPDSSEVPWYGTGTGKAFAAKFFESLGKECDFSRFEPHDFLASDTQVACLVNVESTIRRNGRKLSQTGVHYFTIKNGRVTKWRGWEDTASTQAAWAGKSYSQRAAAAQ
jgi:hypothetical protein